MTHRQTSTLLIANPAAGRGRALRMLPHVRAALASHDGTHVQLTERPGDERRLAEEATHAGVDTIIALGGDGTWGNVARGILAGGGGARLALLAAGTGNDLAFASGIPDSDVRAALDIALGKRERRIDVGSADGVHFVNCVGFGFDAEVVRRLGEVRWARGHAVYVVTAVRQLLTYRGLDVRLRKNGDAASSPRQNHLMVVISNGARFGGGFMIAPSARNDDGVLDLVCVSDAPVWRRATLLASAMSGRHVGSPEVSMSRITTLTLDFDEAPVFEADGELHHASSSSVTVRCLPGALRLAVGER
ncbi:MAG: diacylglycerol kinase family protein [Gemmatimonadaceae bacterium]